MSGNSYRFAEGYDFGTRDFEQCTFTFIVVTNNVDQLFLVCWAVLIETQLVGVSPVIIIYS